MAVLFIHFHGALRLKLPSFAKKLLLEWLATAVGMRGKVNEMLEVSKEKQVKVIFGGKLSVICIWYTIVATFHVSVGSVKTHPSPVQRMRSCKNTKCGHVM